MLPAARILVVDADERERRGLIRTLVEDGHRVQGARSEAEGARTARGWSPELLLIDPKLPDGDGLRLIRSLRFGAERPPVPVILLGGPRGERPPAEVSGAGVGFHPKPADPSRLSAQVRRALGPPRLEGNLSLMGLPALLSHFEAERATGTLRVSAGACLEIRGGRVVRARMAGRAPRGAELVYALLPLASGTFEFSPGPVEGEDEIGAPAAALLLEGARRLDEAASAPSGSNPDRPFRTESGSPGGSTL